MMLRASQRIEQYSTIDGELTLPPQPYHLVCIASAEAIV